MTKTTITLNQFHNLLADAYAVCANDTLYFVGYDTDDNPYIADNDGNDYVDLSTVDGDIDRKSTRLNSSHVSESRMPSSA